MRIATFDVFSMVLAGAVAGLAFGMALVRYVEALFCHHRHDDKRQRRKRQHWQVRGLHVAALPPVIRAIRIDPVTLLRAE